ncbi:MAG: 3-phosphoshikimate 1-carboxyvinyltransferase [Bacteroidota bacterium]
MYSLVYKKKALNYCSVNLPASKSISNRALILNAFLKQQVRLQNLSLADDTQLMIKALSQSQPVVNLENAGTCMRFLTAYFACMENQVTELLCNERMKQRPIKELVEVLNYLGADIEYLAQSNYPPLKIKGATLSGKPVEIDASQSSQYITALMLIGPFIQNGLSIQLKDQVASFDYIKMTASLMHDFGFDVLVNEMSIEIKPLSKPILLAEYTIEKDWSSAAFWYLMVALEADLKVCLNGLSKSSIQGDKVTADIFEKLGVRSEAIPEGLLIYKYSSPVSDLHFDLSACIDLAPALCVACAALNIKATIFGLQNLVIKESNRLVVIVNELSKLGYHITHTSNSIFIDQMAQIDYQKAVVIDTYDDHRIAMAFAPLAILFSQLQLKDIQVVSKSYPTYFDDLSRAGITVK